MTQEEQIEEMASIINGSLCSEYYPEPIYIPSATELYNAGYRKQSEVVIEIFAEIEELLDKYYDEDVRAYHPLPHYDLWLGDDIAELKKKYTEPDAPKGD